MHLTRRRLTFAAVGAALLAVGVSLGSCGNASGTSRPVLPTFAPVVPLTAVDVDRIIARAAAATDRTDVHIAVVDRTGGILGAFNKAGAFTSGEDNIAVALARTTAFFSNSQAPLSSRTVETLASFHFPPTFSSRLLSPREWPNSAQLSSALSFLAPRRTTTGIVGTPQGPLWQINSTNRGADIATGATDPVTFFEPGADAFGPSTNIDGSTPSPGIVLLPGAVPLYKAGRLVGGVGVFVGSNFPDPVDLNGVTGPNVELAEFCAIEGASGREAQDGGDNYFLEIPSEGAITIVGILLPYVKQVTRPAGTSRDTVPIGFAPGFSTPVDLRWRSFDLGGGQVDPFNFLIGPREARYGTNQVDTNTLPVNERDARRLTEADVRLIIDQVVESANLTRAQVRLPLGSGAKVIATVVDTRGLILAHFRMEDTLCDAVDVVPAKARSVVYYCLPSSLPTSAAFNNDVWPGFPTSDPRGVALTTRTLGFLSQPFFPPGIDENPPGPLYNLALANQLPGQIERWGNAPSDPGYQNGLTFFPGSVPLYKNGELVGALGVSGDGVEQNDLIAADGGRGFEPPPELRIDNFSFQGVRLPYLKFPETPR